MNSLENTLQDFIELSELQSVLGYKDNRSVKKWCEQRKIQTFKLGLNVYVNLNTILQYIDNQLVIFVKGNKNVPQSNLKIIKNADFNKDKDTKPETSKDEENLKIIRNTYDPKNAIISKYLSKYESNSKSQPSQKRPS